MATDSGIDPDVLRFLQQQAGSSGSSDPSKSLITQAPSYLTGQLRDIGMPGGSDVSVGAGPAPAPGVNVGTFGQNFGGGPAESGAVGAGGSAGGGSNILGLIEQGLSAGGKTADFLRQLLGGDPNLGTRGNVGGEGTPQDSNTSFSDQLRSLVGGADSGAGALGGPNIGQAFRSMTPAEQALFSSWAGPGVMPGGVTGFSLGEIPGGGASIPSGVEGAGGASGLSGDIGLGGMGAGALGAILDLIAGATGSADLAKAGEALSTAGTAAGLAGTGASLAATGGELAATAGGATLGAAGGAAAAPIAAMLLATSIANMINPGSAPSIMDPFTEDPNFAGNYPFFGPKLTKTLGLENTDVNTLASSLPYATSQPELQALLDTFKTSVGSRVGGYGAGSDPFTIPALPGATGTAHEGNQVANFDSETQVLNQLIAGLKGGLPATGGGDPAQLWNQVVSQNVSPDQAPYQVTKPDGSVAYMTPSDYQNYFNQQALVAQSAGGALPMPEFLSDVIQFGQPGYSYAGGGLVAPGNAPGAPSDAWTKMIAQLTGRGASPSASDTMSPDMIAMLASGGSTPTAPGTPLPDVYTDFLKSQQQQAA